MGICALKIKASVLAKLHSQCARFQSVAGRLDILRNRASNACVLCSNLANHLDEPTLAYPQQVAKPIGMDEVKFDIQLGNFKVLRQRHPMMTFANMQQITIRTNRNYNLVILTSG